MTWWCFVRRASIIAWKKEGKMLVSEERLKDIANRNLGVVRGYAVDIGLSELAEIARELQSWRESGALEALNSVCRAFTITQESDEAEKEALKSAYFKCRASIKALEAIK
jgi:hypothetical protein